jgi:Translationally controlled tumour protein
MMVESKMITKADGDVDVGCGNAFGGGGEDEGADSGVQQVNNVIDGFSLTETQIGSASDFKAWLKEYMQAVRGKLKEAGTPQEDIKAFMVRGTSKCRLYMCFARCPVLCIYYENTGRICC